MMHPVLKKLNFTNQPILTLINAPEEFLQIENSFVDSVRIEKEIKQESMGFILAFVITCEQIEDLADQIRGRLSEDAIVWIAYPKKSSKKYHSAISRYSGWQPIGDLGYEVVRQVAIDSDWSALRFRNVKFIQSLKRKSLSALSQEGKNRLKTKIPGDN